MKTYLLSLALLMLGANAFCAMTAAADKQKQYAPAFLQEALKKQKLEGASAERAEKEKEDAVRRGEAAQDVKPPTIEKQKQYAPAGLQKALEKQELKGQSARRK